MRFQFSFHLLKALIDLNTAISNYLLDVLTCPRDNRSNGLSLLCRCGFHNALNKPCVTFDMCELSGILKSIAHNHPSD